MGFNFSRPQYGYRERFRPSEYFRVCDPSDCFCGGPTHYRQRHVAVHRLPGGQEFYQDPMDIIDAMLGGRGYGMPGLMPTYGPQLPGMIPGMSGGLPFGFGGGSAAGLPGNVASFGGIGNLGGLPASLGNIATSLGAIPGLSNAMSSGNIAAIPGFGGLSHSGWPSEWKDPREWTTRDYDRLGEIMGEYLSRQRGRNMFPGPNTGYVGFGQPSPFNPSSLMDMPWDSSNRKSHRHRPSYSDFDQLQDQMFAYAQQAKEHMQAVNDCLYGSEREQREERYRDRQRKMMEEILKSLMNTGRNGDLSAMGQPNTQTLPGSAYPMNPMMGMPGYMGGNPMSGMPWMYPGGMDPMTFAQTEGLAQRAGIHRSRRGARGLGYNDGFDGGGFEEAPGRRPRRRRGFDEGDDDMMEMGDGRRFPNDPRGPRRPRPGTDGAAVDDPARTEPQTSRFAAYEPPSEPLRYEASPQPHIDTRQGQWVAPGQDPAAADASTARYMHNPPQFDRRAPPPDHRDPGRAHVSYQDPNLPEDERARRAP